MSLTAEEERIRDWQRLDAHGKEVALGLLKGGAITGIAGFATAAGFLAATLLSLGRGDAAATNALLDASWISTGVAASGGVTILVGGAVMAERKAAQRALKRLEPLDELE